MLKINFSRPVWQAQLIAEGTVVQRGRTMGYVECSISDEQNRLVAKRTPWSFATRRPQRSNHSLLGRSATEMNLLAGRLNLVREELEGQQNGDGPNPDLYCRTRNIANDNPLEETQQGSAADDGATRHLSRTTLFLVGLTSGCGSL